MFADLQVYLGVALAGLVSFLSPCVLPLVPPYLGYLGGTTIDELAAEEGVPRHVWSRVVTAAIIFVLGFTTVFVLLGAGASFFGQLIQSYKRELEIAAGLVIILFGLHFVGLYRVALFYKEARYHRPHHHGVSYVGAYVIGLAFAFGWTPCIGPVLATVLALAANEASLATGVKLLFVYSLGLGIPFVLAAVAVQPFIAFLQRFRRHLDKVELAMGVVLILTGILFLTGSINWLGSWLIETFPGLAQIEQLVTPQDLGEKIMQRGAGR